MQLHIMETGQETNYKRWLRIGLYTLFLLGGQTVSALLARMYYDNGGKSNWLVTSLQFLGFPILLPFYFLAPKTPATADAFTDATPPSALQLAIVYVPLGLLYAADGLLFSLGLLYLPVSTYALLSSSQLAFNAIFSFFLNGQKFTSYIINSLFLLTISSVLLVFDCDRDSGSSESRDSTRYGNFAIGFICTVAASAGLGLLLSLTQYAFTKVIKQETFKVVMDMIVYQSVVASAAMVIGLFASGDWNQMEKEEEEFKLGKVAYAMVLLWTTVFWQVNSIGSMGLVFEVSSLFSNAIGILGVPLTPVLAAIVYHEKMTGIKSMSMMLAIWGLASYVYQQYLDDLSPKQQIENVEETQTPDDSSDIQRLLNSYNSFSS